MEKFAVLITCHNRADKTLKCLETILSSSTQFALDVYLTDDGSTDGTSEQVQSRFPGVAIIRGDGSLFWSGGMQAAWATAENAGHYDFIIWANDDVEFSPPAFRASLERAVQLHGSGCGKATVLVGCIVDPQSGEVAYSGVKRPFPILRPLYFERIVPSGTEVECETFNGNFVIIPAAVFDAIGGMNPAYIHAFGDYDYGFRARKAGFSCSVLPDPVGTCTRNPWVSTAKIKAMPFLQRWRRITGPKLYPLSGWFRYSRAHTGPFWPFFFLRPYWEAVFPWLFSRLR